MEAHLIALACQRPGQGTGQARWTLRLLADKLVELGQGFLLPDGSKNVRAL
ncbi:helix-turn-helix domain-containing protein [Meiothermus sp. CFH 77666]|uniref:helix-turn-helix domain-containing protein n=1 Tax=Meiothermus sp. CFH 77666 TaxID=2817942 RepID=UPI001AA040A9|nr:helix-turn-helix domain-containing protein [Meiothermus sp. CFH 77666]MBO1436252.1 helix-turn-helix domain-containing protein [Meiothermus sp. CFH 77666]